VLPDSAASIQRRIIMSTRQDGRRSTRSRKTDAVVRELLSDDGTVVEYGRTVEQNAAGGGMAQSESAELSALEAAQNRLDRFREELQQQDRDQIKKSVAYVDDVTSAIWAAPFFGAFASMRLMMLGLCSELMMLVAIMFTDGGLAYPGWIAFSAAVLALVTGMPMWWEPMTLNALRVHIIVGAAACALTTIIATAMGNDDRDATLEATGEPCDFDCGIDDPNQRNKVVGLYAGQAALELVGLLFALRVRLDRGRVQKYEVARLGEWTMDVENYVFSRYVHGGRRQDDGRRADRRRVTRVDDEEVYAGRRDVYQDPDLQVKLCSAKGPPKPVSNGCSAPRR
jgi:hypothetical protein